MKTIFRLPSELLRSIRKDLDRPHPFAHERVGFVVARAASLPDGGLNLVGYEYLPVADDHYLNRPDVGAFVSADGFRVPLQHAYRNKCSIFHIHLHPHRGPPRFGEYDLRENAKFVPDFFNVSPGVPHGALILSHDQAGGLCWPSKGAPRRPVDEVIEVGAPFRIFRGLIA